MFTSPNIVLYAALFVGLLLSLEGVYRLVLDARMGPRAQINRRLRMLAEQTADPRQVLQTLLREPGRAGLVRRLPALADLERLLAQAGLSLTAGRLLGIMAGIGILVFVILRLVSTLPLLPCLAIAFVLAILPTMLFLLIRKGRRLRRFEEQLPDALDLLVRSLRVGHPLSSALNVVATEMSDPIGTEFGVAVDEITYGQEVPDALERLARRIDLQDLRYLVVVITIQHNSGGNLAEVLNGLAKVIRDRFQMFRKVKALTADGRLSAWFLSIFPIGMMFAMQLVKSDYYSSVADTPLFKPLAILTFVLLAVNVLAMRLMTNLKV